MKKEHHKIVRELVRILLRDEYLDFLLVYKKFPCGASILKVRGIIL